MLLSYARVSTPDQNLALQRDALAAAGCERLFEDTASGASPRLAARQELLDYARPDDVVVVSRLDRLGRSLQDLVTVVVAMGERAVALRSLHEGVGTTSPAGRLTFHLFAAMAEFEAAWVRERTRAGLSAARRRGTALGRPRALDADHVEIARTPLANPKLSARQVAGQLGVHRATLYRSLPARWPCRATPVPRRPGGNERPTAGVCACSPKGHPVPVRATPYAETVEGDCSGQTAATSPAAPDACNGFDDDCEGLTEEEGRHTTGCVPWYVDLDEDGYGDANQARCLCRADGAWTTRTGGDCDDDAQPVHPDALEVCNGGGVDDCDGTTDEGSPRTRP